MGDVLKMKNVSILDCTLRDGGRIIDCKFSDVHIAGITKGLTEAGADIIEMGFLRGDVSYSGNSTFFNAVEQFSQFILPVQAAYFKKKPMFVAFADYGKEFGMWDFSQLPPCDGTSITGIRVGFRKKDLYNAIDTFKIVKEQGYVLFVQGVESLNYTDKEMLEVLDVINEVKPYSFGIVDTYGSMYKDDVIRIYNLVSHNLYEDISIDFHSHNNLQLSFAFAQEIVECSQGKRKIILDATMEGLGKGTGNLNTELIMDYLNCKHKYDYDLDALLDTIDEYIYILKKDYNWTYTIPYFMAGVYSSHANNITYLTEKHKLSTKDIQHILSMIEPEKRKRYDYANIEKLYIEYFSMEVDDKKNIEYLRTVFVDRSILVLVPGYSLNEYRSVINGVIGEKNPVIISVNFIDGIGENRFCFFGNERRYKKYKNDLFDAKIIITSNIKSLCKEDVIVNYNKLIKRELKYFDNSTIMLLNLLYKLGKEEVMIAGFDGISKDHGKVYIDDSYDNYGYDDDPNVINAALEILLKDHAKYLRNKMSVRFITPSRFEHIFTDSLVANSPKSVNFL
jgi:4-hydroxy 2-oxovalerate aldolase